MQELHSLPGFSDRIFTPNPSTMNHHHQQVSEKCPRCQSPNTKFCYFNNYNTAQPRYFCRTCRRYWTKGGVLRNVPVGGGCRKNRRSSSSSSSTSSVSAKQRRTVDRKRHGVVVDSSSQSTSCESTTVVAAESCVDVGPMRSNFDPFEKELVLGGGATNFPPLDWGGAVDIAETGIVDLDGVGVDPAVGVGVSEYWSQYGGLDPCMFFP